MGMELFRLLPMGAGSYFHAISQEPLLQKARQVAAVSSNDANWPSCF